MKNISVIIPIYNEEENLPELFEEITKEKYKLIGESKVICLEDEK